MDFYVLMEHRGPLYVSRFRVIAASLMLELCGGSIYLVGLYNDPLQAIWFSKDPSGQDKMETLIFCSQIGNWLPMAGIFYDSRFGGPKRTVAVAATLTLIGYGGLFLCATHPPEEVSGAYVVLLGFFFFCWGHGSGYFDCTAIATTAYNFPRERGSAVGVAKALYGLSGSLLTQVYQAFFVFEPHAQHFPGFLAFLAFFLSGLGYAMIPFVQLIDSSDAMARADRPRYRLKVGAVLILILALCLMLVSNLRAFTDLGKLDKPSLSTPFSYGTFALSIVGGLSLWIIAWGASVRAPDKTLLNKGSPEYTSSDEANDVVDAPPINTDAEGAARRGGDVGVGIGGGSGASDAMPAAPSPNADDETAASGDDQQPSAVSAMAPLTNGTLLSNITSVNFWLIFIAFFGGAGGGLVFNNHVNYMVKAAYGPNQAQWEQRIGHTLVSLLSVCSCLGRLGFGIGSDAFQRYVTRPQLFAFATALMGLSHALLLGASVVEFLFLAAICNGLAYGGFWALIPTLVGDLFGQKAFASTYNAFTLAVSGSSLILAKELATSVAEAHTPPPPNASVVAPPCYGSACYALTHVVVIVLNAVGVLTASLLSVRTRNFYRQRRPRLPRGDTRWRR